MSKPLADILKDMFKRGEIPMTPEIETLLASKPFSEAQLPDDLATQFGGKFITVKDAAEHPTVRSSLKGMYAGTWEGVIKRHLMTKRNWTDDDWREFRGSDPNSSILDRIDTILDKNFESGKKEGEKTGGGNPDEIRKQLREEIGKEYTTKLDKNAATIKDYETRLGEQETALKQTKEDSIKQIFTLKRDTYLNEVISSLPVRKDFTAVPDLKAATYQTILGRLTNEAELIEENGKW